MTVTSSPRLGLTRWSTGTDPHTRAQQDGAHASLDDLVAIDRQGLRAARPAGNIRGTWYYCTDTGETFRNNGTGWVEHVTYNSGRLAVGPAAIAGTIGDSQIAVDTVGTTRRGVTVRSAAGATASPVVVETSAGTVRARIEPDGSLRLGDADAARLGFVTIRPLVDERGLVVSSDNGAAAAAVVVQTDDGDRRFAVDFAGRMVLRTTGLGSAATSGAGILYVDNLGRLVFREPSNIGGALRVLTP